MNNNQGPLPPNFSWTFFSPWQSYTTNTYGGLFKASGSPQMVEKSEDALAERERRVSEREQSVSQWEQIVIGRENAVKRLEWELLQRAVNPQSSNGPYSILHLTKDAPLEVVEAAYRALSRAYHPDTHPNDAQAAEKMKTINKAMEQIRREKGR